MRRKKTVDDYISLAEEWSDELARLREILCSTSLIEEIKWGLPCYTHTGKNVVSIVAFKSYFGLWFYNGAFLRDDKNLLMNAQEGKTKGLRQWRMHRSGDVKPTLIKRYVREAMQLVDAGKQVVPDKAKPLRMPPELQQALQQNRIAKKMFDSLSPGKQREYADYVAAAKRDATRLTRAEKVLPLICTGVGLQDKYRS